MPTVVKLDNDVKEVLDEAVMFVAVPERLPKKVPARMSPAVPAKTSLVLVASGIITKRQVESS